MTTPQHVLDSTEFHTESTDVVLPPKTELLTNGGKLELPIGSQLTRPKLEDPALVTLPNGGQVERLQESADSVVYRLPPNTEIRFPTNIRWPLAMVVAQSVAAICLWGTLVGSMLPLSIQQTGLRPRLCLEPIRCHVCRRNGHHHLLFNSPHLATVAAFLRNSPTGQTLNVNQRMPDVHLQHLALHLDRADEHPDLFLIERLRVRRSQLFEFFRHRRVLIRGDLQLEARPFPGIAQRPAARGVQPGHRRTWSTTSTGEPPLAATLPAETSQFVARVPYRSSRLGICEFTVLFNGVESSVVSPGQPDSMQREQVPR